MSDKQKFEELVDQVYQLNDDYYLATDYHEVAMVANQAVSIIGVIKEMYESGKIKFESN